MPIKQLVLEPPLAIDWIHRPISSQIRNDKRKKNSKLLILDDISIQGMLEDTKSKNVNILLCSKVECPELMLTPEIIGNNASLQKLSDAYLSLQLAKDKGFSRGSLMLFLRIMLCASDDTKSYGMLKTLKEWFQTPKENIASVISKVKIKKKYELPKMEQAIKMFSQSIDYTEGILDFLWRLHGSNAWQENQKSNQSALTSGIITVVPASIFKQDTYFYLLFIFGVICKMEVFIDADVSFKLISSYLTKPENVFSIARYANSNYSELSFLAANAENMLSSAQIPDQSLFFSWLASKNGDALQDFSLAEMNDVLKKNPYVRFIGMYFSLAKNKLSLTQYNLKSQRWKQLYFDLHLISKKTLHTKDAEIPNHKGNTTPSLSKAELNDALSESLKKVVGSSFSDVKNNLNLLCSKVDSLSSSIDKAAKNISEIKEKTSVKYTQPKIDLSEIKEVSDKLTNLSALLVDLPKSIDKRIGNFLEDYSPTDDSDDMTSKKIDKKFDDALSQQKESEATNFDD